MRMTMRETAPCTALEVMRPNSKDPTPQRHDEGGKVVDEEMFFVERLKIEIRCPGAQALLGDVHAQFIEVAHELGAPK